MNSTVKLVFSMHESRFKLNLVYINELDLAIVYLSDLPGLEQHLENL